MMMMIIIIKLLISMEKGSSQAQVPQLANIRCAPVSTGNTFQDLPRVRETAHNTERYI
jgi:predicted histidine transporter YuiF (NhaC family)